MNKLAIWRFVEFRSICASQDTSQMTSAATQYEFPEAILLGGSSVLPAVSTFIKSSANVTVVLDREVTKELVVAAGPVLNAVGRRPVERKTTALLNT
ncbi:hypothetical protein pipiens_016472 [Culex pipiens pipiens]|uniref:Uncharacterized protein n=1 Tax=Culex pipiens pipiens TaxID=38569 RepID=A0ABD1CL40_CULPP